jgi:hypothetical protein
MIETVRIRDDRQGAAVRILVVKAALDVGGVVVDR